MVIPPVGNWRQPEKRIGELPRDLSRGLRFCKQL